MAEDDNSEELNSGKFQPPAASATALSPLKPAAPGLGGLKLPGGQQLGLLVIIAAALTLVGVVFFWALSPAYRVLYHDLADKDASEVMDALDKAGIPYKVDAVTGDVRVPSDKLHAARFRLAADGLPRGTGAGLEFLDEAPSFGTSRFAEIARYQHALETELARSISSLGGVKSARVHLALPKESVFVRNNKPPSASVVVHLFRGRVLEQGQVDAVAHLVASSVPRLTASKVSVIDQRGQLLSRRSRTSALALSMEQLEYSRQVEESYVSRIEDLLNPIVGVGRVRARVMADLDFTAGEQTEERFLPKEDAMRSEQFMEERSVGAGPEGIPGALSNEPPGPGEPALTGSTAEAESGVNAKRVNKRVERIRNYELDKTISHKKFPSGQLRRLSVAVVLDDRIVRKKNGGTASESFTQDELDRLTELVKDAVGFDAERGDSVNVVNSTFTAPDIPAEMPWWKEEWILSLARLLLIGAIGIVLVFAVVRPLFRTVAQRYAAYSAAGARRQLPPPGAGMGSTTPTGQGGRFQEPDADILPPDLLEPDDYQAHVRYAQNLTAEDPRRAAQVIKRWLQDGA